MSIVSNINKLGENITASRDNLCKNLKDKGVAVEVTPNSTISELSTHINEIVKGSGKGLNFKALGFNQTPQKYIDGLSYINTSEYKGKINMSGQYGPQYNFDNDDKLVFLLYEQKNASRKYSCRLNISNCKNLEYLKIVGLYDSDNNEVSYPKITNCPNLKEYTVLNTKSTFCWIGEYDDFFNGCHSLEKINASSLQTKGWGRFSLKRCFNECYNLKNIPIIYGTTCGALPHAFYGCHLIENINFSPEFRGLDANDVSYAFSDCYSLISFDHWIQCANSKYGSLNYNSIYRHCFSLIDGGGLNFLNSISPGDAINKNYLFGEIDLPKLVRFRLFNIKKSHVKTIDLSRLVSLGKNTAEIPSAEADFKNWITTEYGGSAGITLVLSEYTKSLLTSSDMAKISSNNITIA